MKVQLQTERSTSNPTATAIVAARGDYMSDSLVGADFETVMDGTDKDKREFIETMIQRGHWGPLEHPQAFFAVEGISRVTMAQLTRHRHLSFDVQSMRYVDFSDAGFTVPESFDIQDPDRMPDAMGNPAVWYREYLTKQLVMYYQQLVDAGVPEEDARFVLPLGTQVNLTFSGNVRSLLHVLDLRHSGKAQHEIRELSNKIIDEMEEWCPIIIDEWREHAKNSSLQSP